MAVCGMLVMLIGRWKKWNIGNLLFNINFFQIKTYTAMCRLLLTVSQNAGNTAAAFGYRAPVYPQKYPPRANAGVQAAFGYRGR